MTKKPLSHNRIFVLGETIVHFFHSSIRSVWILLLAVTKKDAHPLKTNRFLELVHFVFVTAPKKFWKFPTAIGAGRSIGTLLTFIFERDQKFHENPPKKSKKGFTLIEVMISVVIFAIILIGAFQAMGQVGIQKIVTGDKLTLEQDLYANVEQLVSTIKNGGSIDYEEYWNRQSIGTETSSGHYKLPSGFGNYGATGNIAAGTFGDNVYLCRSNSTTLMGTGGCLSDGNFNTAGANLSGQFARYGQYRQQFIDYNSNKNSDACPAHPTGILGDENCDGIITGDDDDEDLGRGPFAFTGAKELYLIKTDSKIPERTAIRWHVIQDPQAPAGKTCNAITEVGEGCLGRLEILKLEGKDLGLNHTTDSWTPSPGRYDGVIDTWKCAQGFQCSVYEGTPNGSDSEWASLFSDDINIASVEFAPFPLKDPKYSWKETDNTIFVSPYVRLKITVGFSWKKRIALKKTAASPLISITTTVNLPR